jgi:hypothetical protein
MIDIINKEDEDVCLYWEGYNDGIKDFHKGVSKWCEENNVALADIMKTVGEVEE